MEGMPELAEEVMGIPVRRGSPRGIGGLVDVVRSPKYATGVGLVLFGAEKANTPTYGSRVERAGFGTRVKDWFARVF
jgi:cell division protein FtsA